MLLTPWTSNEGNARQHIVTFRGSCREVQSKADFSVRLVLA